MKAAHQGVPVAGLPLGDWRDADAPAFEPAPPAPPMPIPEAAGAPLTINKGGEAALGAPVAAPVKRAVTPADWNAPVPPASIPNVPAASSPPSRDKNLLSKLLGAI